MARRIAAQVSRGGILACVFVLACGICLTAAQSAQELYDAIADESLVDMNEEEEDPDREANVLKQPGEHPLENFGINSDTMLDTDDPVSTYNYYFPSSHPGDYELTFEEREVYVKAFVDELMEMDKYWVGSPAYLRSGFLTPANLKMLLEITKMARSSVSKDVSIYSTYDGYSGTIDALLASGDATLDDINYLFGWEYNVTRLYTATLTGAETWTRYATGRYDYFFDQMYKNLTHFEHQVDKMKKAHRQAIRLHHDAGTQTGFLGSNTNKRSKGEEFTFAMNVMNFIISILNMIGLVTFLVLKRRVGPSAVLDTEMTFPSSPTAQI